MFPLTKHPNLTKSRILHPRQTKDYLRRTHDALSQFDKYQNNPYELFDTPATKHINLFQNTNNAESEATSLNNFSFDELAARLNNRPTNEFIAHFEQYIISNPNILQHNAIRTAFIHKYIPVYPLNLTYIVEHTLLPALIQYSDSRHAILKQSFTCPPADRINVLSHLIPYIRIKEVFDVFIAIVLTKSFSLYPSSAPHIIDILLAHPDMITPKVYKTLMNKWPAYEATWISNLLYPQAATLCQRIDNLVTGYESTESICQHIINESIDFSLFEQVPHPMTQAFNQNLAQPMSIRHWINTHIDNSNPAKAKIISLIEAIDPPQTILERVSLHRILPNNNRSTIIHALSIFIHMHEIEHAIKNNCFNLDEQLAEHQLVTTISEEQRSMWKEASS